MNISDYNRILNINSIATGSWKVYYDFSRISGDSVVINSLYSADSQYSGGFVYIDNNPGFIVSLNSGEFNDYLGSGFFSGTAIFRVSNYLNEQNWTMFLGYKNFDCNIERNKSTVLITNQNTPASTSGFSFGFNGANKFFLEYNDISGKNTYTSSYENKNNSLISLSKNNNFFELSSHDFANSSNTLEAFELPNYVNSNIYFLGNTFSGANTNYTGFKGFVDDFLYFSGYIGYGQRNNLAGGIFCSSITPATTVSIVTGYNKISSGRYVNAAVIGTGITGFQRISVGTIPTRGGSISIFSQSGVTGLLYGEQIQFITGVTTGSKRISITIPETINYDANRLSNYSNNRLKLLYSIDSGDFIEINTYTGFLDNYRKVTQYDNTLQQFLLGLESTGQSINLFSNGVFQQSGFNISGNIVSGNYNLSGNRYVNSNGFFDQFTDSIVYFDTKTTPQVINFTGSSYTYTLNNNLNNSMYLNGQKLISGYNYTISGPTITFNANINDSTGRVLATSRTSIIYSTFTGNYVVLTGDLVPLTEEQIYLNGILQEENQNYVKTNCQSLLNSLFYPAQKPYNYYNNEDTSFNIL
jgi:hypothetical protein